MIALMVSSWRATVITDDAWPEGPELRCTGIGPLADQQILIAGILGGGLHTVADDGWAVDVVYPDWPIERVILSAPNVNPFTEEAADGWRQIHCAELFELRACGFSPSGNTLVIADRASLIILMRSHPLGQA